VNVITANDLMSYEEYERQREAFRTKIIALKQRRRISVGPFITMVLKTGKRCSFRFRK
jgi:hypothetical protein